VSVSDTAPVKALLTQLSQAGEETTVIAGGNSNDSCYECRYSAVETMLVKQICQASGGSCTYMGPRHENHPCGMGVSSRDFDAFLGDLVATLYKFTVPDREKNELLGAFGAMRATSWINRWPRCSRFRTAALKYWRAHDDCPRLPPA
jgi:hypothetical protein